MSEARWKPQSKVRVGLCALSSGILLWLVLLFPGRRLFMAFSIGSGLGRDGLQTQLDLLEQKAILKISFSEEDKEFVSDFYRTLAQGGRLILVARQAGLMMDHYLDAKGTAYELDSVIFTSNTKV